MASKDQNEAQLKELLKKLDLENLLDVRAYARYLLAKQVPTDIQFDKSRRKEIIKTIQMLCENLNDSMLSIAWDDILRLSQFQHLDHGKTHQSTFTQKIAGGV